MLVRLARLRPQQLLSGWPTEYYCHCHSTSFTGMMREYQCCKRTISAALLNGWYTASHTTVIQRPYHSHTAIPQPYHAYHVVKHAYSVFLLNGWYARVLSAWYGHAHAGYHACTTVLLARYKIPRPGYQPFSGPAKRLVWDTTHTTHTTAWPCDFQFSI